MTPWQAQAAAWEDAQTLAAKDARYARYVFVHDGTTNSAKLVNLTANYVSRARTIRRAQVVGKGRLVRLDLRQLSDTDEDLAELLVLWEEFRYDPSFCTLITRDSLTILQQAGIDLPRGVRPYVEQTGKKRVLVDAKPYEQDGEVRDARWVDVIQIPGIHLDAEIDTGLRRVTGSSASVIDDRYFHFRALSTIKDDDIDKDDKTYQVVFGGLYYDLAGIRQNKTGKGTDEDLLFEQLGIGDVAKGLTAEVIFGRAKSEQRSAMFRSKVTAKPRRIDFFPTLSTRFGDGQGFLAVTHDIANKDVGVGRHPMANLLNFKDRAREDIFRKPNGLHGFALFDGNGKRADFAPDTVVADHEIPKPHTKQLQGAISCIRCHGVYGEDGLKPAANEVQLFRKNYISIYGDLGEKTSFREQLDKLAGLYAGDHEAGMVVARRDYIKAILQATGPYQEDAKDAQVNIGKLTAQGYTAMWQAFWYDPVDARIALQELGYDVRDSEVDDTQPDGSVVKVKFSVKLLRTLLPPPEPGKKLAPGEFVLEDFRLAGLLMGTDGITRTDQALSYSFQAARARATEAKLNKEKL